MEASRLESYLDLLSQSALILTYQHDLSNSLRVKYVKNDFLDITEDGHVTDGERYGDIEASSTSFGVAENFISVLVYNLPQHNLYNGSNG
jgi:hypothetical protein